MQSRPLAVAGAWEFTPRLHPDARGVFVSPYQEGAFVAATGRPLRPVAQTNHSVSCRGVVRGAHFTATPPGTSKYVYCARGRALDIVVDLRVGSPTFGRFDTVEMDQESMRAMYLPLGVGHAFVALEDQTVMSYLLSSSYVAEIELAVKVDDPELGLPIPADIEPIMSQRDLSAPTLADARNRGILPDWEVSRKLEEQAPLAVR